jgi:uncharacterized protein YjbJ (UPF0337 family)
VNGGRHCGRPTREQTKKENEMNEDKIQGNWKQLVGKLKQRWGKLTDDDLKVAEGSGEYLVGRIQERYGIARDEAKKQIKEFYDQL